MWRFEEKRRITRGLGPQYNGCGQRMERRSEVFQLQNIWAHGPTLQKSKGG